jgi:hypothetical protein
VGFDQVGEVNKLEILVVCFAGAVIIGLFVYGLSAMETPRERQARQWTEPCADESALVATTAGSPNSFTCSNRNHRMRLEVKTQSGEEIAALVVCECARPAQKASP